jgi:hypothetical protein
MAQFQVEVRIAAPVSVVWARLTDWPAHAQLAPVTTIRVIGSGNRPGSGFVARTGVGPLAFDDPMEIEEFEPPAGNEAEAAAAGRPAARFLVRKTGRLLRGWIVAEVWAVADRSGPDRVVVGRAAIGSGGPGAEAAVAGPDLPWVSRLVWTEEIRVPPERLTRFADPLVGAVARAGYGAALRKLGREIEREPRG